MRRCFSNFFKCVFSSVVLRVFGVSFAVVRSFRLVSGRVPGWFLQGPGLEALFFKFFLLRFGFLHGPGRGVCVMS